MKNLAVFLYFWVFLCMFINEINSAAYFIANSEDPEFPGFCSFKDDLTPDEFKVPLYLQPGETRQHPTECYEISCGFNFQLSVTGCGIAQGTEQCPFIEGNKNDPYPICCGTIECQK